MPALPSSPADLPRECHPMRYHCPHLCHDCHYSQDCHYDHDNHQETATCGCEASGRVSQIPKISFSSFFPPGGIDHDDDDDHHDDYDYDDDDHDHHCEDDDHDDDDDPQGRLADHLSPLQPGSGPPDEDRCLSVYFELLWSFYNSLLGMDVKTC